MKSILISLVVSLLLAGAVPAPAVEVVDPSEVPPGTKGVCVTEMDGGERVEIPLTVLGSVGPYAPELEMVLVRLDDPRFVKTGIIAGMSGSPVYVDGRLLGALAYGWSFSTEPIGGVTPFARMAGLAEGGVPAAPGTEAGAVVARPTLGEVVEARREARLDQLLLDWLAPPSSGTLRPLPLALSMTGPGSLPAAGWVSEMWSRMGWVSGPGAVGSDGASSGPLAPGSMMAALLVDGDITLGAGGTVTEVRGDQVWAFGHPFLSAGQIDFPLARARVVTVLPSQMQSFKFFAAGDIVGSLRVDRTHGVWGLLGSPAPMVPVDVAVDGRSYSFRAIPQGVLLPSIVGYLATSSLASRGRTFGDQTVDLDVSLTYDGGETAVLRESFAGPDASLQAAALAAAAVGFLQNSSFDRPALESVQLGLASSEGLDSLTLVSATPERWVVRPGESLPVTVRLRPYRGPEFNEVLEITIPESVDEGRLDLVVADGASWTAYDLTMRPPRASSFRHEVAMFDRLVSSRRIVLALENRQIGVALPGGTLPVPPSVAVQMRSALGANLETTEYAVVTLETHEMPASVSGAERLPLTVRLEERGTR